MGSLSRPQSAEVTDEKLSALKDLFIAYHDRLERNKEKGGTDEDEGHGNCEGKAGVAVAAGEAAAEKPEEGRKEDEVRSEEDAMPPPPDALQKIHNQDKRTFFSAG